MPVMTDEALMMSFRAGNVYAFELLCERYRTPVFAFLYRLLGRDRSGAEDLLQEVFVKLAGAARFYEPRAKFSTWLFTIVRNHARNHLKSRAFREGRVTVPLDTATEDGGAAPAQTLAAANDTRRDIRNREEGRLLEAAIGRLPDPYREVFILRALQGMSHDETAAVLGLNPATVRTQYHRACERLRRDLGPDFGMTSPRSPTEDPS